MSIKRLKQCCLVDVFRNNDILKMALTVVFLFLFTHTGAKESQWEGPQNTLSVVGSNVTLKCVTPYRNCSQLDWTKYNTGTPMTIFKSGGITATYRERYSIDNSSGCDLLIKNVELTDAGRFICSAIISGNTPTKTAHLIILETQPKCTTNASLNETVEKDGVRLTCEVTYNGTNRASMLWKDVIDAPAAVENNKTISRSYSVDASATGVPSFTCETSFPVETKDEYGTEIKGLATNNMPVVNCATPAIKVLYYVKGVTLSPSLYNYPPGTAITCAAKGHPSPTFKWQETETNGTWKDIQNQKGSQFTMTDVSSKRYRCVAMNVVRGKSYNSSSDEFQVNNTGSTTSDSTTSVTTTPIYLNLTVQIGVGAGVGVILLIVLLLICFLAPCCPGYKCRHSSEKVKIREEQPLTENPDIYSNINDAQLNAPKAKPRSAEPPKLPQNAPPQAKPRTDNKKAVPANAYHHEEVTYAELAREDGPHQVIPKNNHVPQETLYAAVGTA